MPRLHEVSLAEAEAPIVRQSYERMFGEGRDPVAEPGTATGTPGSWWTVLANSPRVLEHIVLGFTLCHEAEIDLRLRELGQLRTAWVRGSKFVWSQHCKGARVAGLSEEQIMATRSWYLAGCYSPVQRAVLAYTDELVLGGGRVADDTFAELRSHLSDEEIVLFTYTTTMYNMHAIIARALRLEYDDVDERITEVDAPDPEAALAAVLATMPEAWGRQPPK